PLIGFAPCAVATRGQRERWRGKAEDIKNQSLVVCLPTFFHEPPFRPPSMRSCLPSILRPLPVGPCVELVGDFTKLPFIVGVAIEILGSQQCACDQESGVNC